MFPNFRHFCFAGMIYFTSNEYSITAGYMKWTGTAYGYTFTAVYIFAVPLLLSMLLSSRYKVRFFPPGSFFYLLYYLAILLSGVNAIHMKQWGFEVYKMFWMYTVFLAAFNYMNNSKNLILFTYMVCGILSFLFIYGLYLKYRMGVFQLHVTFPHQNSFCLYLELFGLLTLGVLMNENISKKLFLLSLFAFVGSLVLIILTYSRGGLVIFFSGIAIVCAFSIVFNGFSIRRLLLMLIGFVVVLSIIGYALPRIIQRFENASPSSKLTRIYLAIAAKRIANDYKLGVGANNFSEYSGYARDYARELYASPGYRNETGRGGIVETIYLLVAAECGWWGLGTLILWFLYYYFSSLISIFVLRKKPCSGLMIGVFGGLTCNYFHSTLEWVLKQPNNFSGLMVTYALIAVVAVNRKNIKAAYQRSLEREKSAKKIFAPSLAPAPASSPAPASTPAPEKSPSPEESPVPASTPAPEESPIPAESPVPAELAESAGGSSAPSETTGLPNL